MTRYLVGTARGQPETPSAKLIGYVVTVAMVGLVSIAGQPIAVRWGNAAVVLLYLLPVLGAAVLFGLWPALFAAVVSTAAFNFFFTAPVRTFLVHSPADLVTVAILFLVALITSHLAHSLREQALIAERHAERNATIAGFARRLLACADRSDVFDLTVTELARLFGCHAVLVTGPDDPIIVARCPGELTLAPSDLAAAACTLATGEPAGRGVSRVDLADWQFHPVSAERAVVAAVGLARIDGVSPVAADQRPLLTNLLDQTALALERARLEAEARDSAAMHQRDQLRSALLASIGDDIKPRLAAIQAATRTLKRGASDPKAAVAAVAAEATRLDRYIDHLVDLSPGSEQEPIQLGAIQVDLFRRLVLRDEVEVHLTPKEYAVMAELARHAGRVLSHAQLLRAVWGPAHEGQIDYLRVAIRSLRLKLEKDPARPEMIINEPAIGYRLAAP